MLMRSGLLPSIAPSLPSSECGRRRAASRPKARRKSSAAPLLGRRSPRATASRPPSATLARPRRGPRRANLTVWRPNCRCDWQFTAGGVGKPEGTESGRTMRDSWPVEQPPTRWSVTVFALASPVPVKVSLSRPSLPRALRWVPDGDSTGRGHRRAASGERVPGSREGERGRRRKKRGRPGAGQKKTKKRSGSRRRRSRSRSI